LEFGSLFAPYKKKGSSFSEEKAAKRLYLFGSEPK
jgi:hypothetical protein